MNTSLLRLSLSFLKVGIIGFGGGSALIPVIHKELVDSQKSLSEDEYLKHTVVANITPGALPVKLGATCGVQLASAPGSVLAAYAASVPGVLATVLLVAFFSTMGPGAITRLNHASLGITVFIIYLLLHYVIKTVKSGNAPINACICLFAFFLTCGKEVREVVELGMGGAPYLLGSPFFNLSMISLMIIAFFCIAWFLLSGRSHASLVSGIFLAAIYATLSGKAVKQWEYATPLRYAVLLAMITGIVMVWYGKGGGRRGNKQIRLNRTILLSMAAFLIIPVLALGYGILSGWLAGTGELYSFLGDVAVSSVTSFGGGEAYVAVADGIFVQTGKCQADIFYSRIVPIANALPGPILIKIASAVGFVWGDALMGMSGGFMLALVSALVAMGVCSALALLVLNYYESLKHSAFVHSLKRYILPVICGSLLSTSLAMLFESMKTASAYGVKPLHTGMVIVCCVAATFFVSSRAKINDIFLLLFWVFSGLLVMHYL